MYTESHGELSISGWDDDLLEDYSVTLGNISTDNTAVSLKIFEIEIFMDKTDFWKTHQIFFFEILLIGSWARPICGKFIHANFSFYITSVYVIPRNSRIGNLMSVQEIGLAQAPERIKFHFSKLCNFPIRDSRRNQNRKLLGPFLVRVLSSHNEHHQSAIGTSLKRMG